MKQTLCVIATTALFFFACKKQSTEAPETYYPSGEKYPIQVNVSDFIKKVETMPLPGARNTSPQAKDSLLSNKVSHIIYGVFQQPNHTFIRQIRQSVNVNPITFGSIRDSLPAGNYTILLIAAQDSVNYVEGTYMWMVPHIEYGVLAPLGDVYAKMFDFTVTPGAPNVIEGTTLNRATGKIEVNVLDGAALEANNQEVVVTVSNLNHRFHVSNFQSEWEMELPMTTLSRITATRYEGHILNKNDLYVTIKVKDKSTGAVISTKTLSNIAVGVNQRTIISGNLTGANSNSNGNWDIHLNQDWNSDIVVEF
ncbi:hypothetical protein [Chitinophaga deserti]|uniref:hypothetical protein n=1 Tax=Chitinophaga deserti TaxID=2164099 RepID=UPI000D6CDD16|nr:hypothetical protein [Chitinophaga deserti]